MNASELAVFMLSWERLMTEANDLEIKIKEAVLSLEKTQVVGNVRATYSGGRKSYDYESAWENRGLDCEVNLEDYEKVTYNYKAACEEAGLDILFTTSEPSVTLKLQEK